MLHWVLKTPLHSIYISQQFPFRHNSITSENVCSQTTHKALDPICFPTEPQPCACISLMGITRKCLLLCAPISKMFVYFKQKIVAGLEKKLSKSVYLFHSSTSNSSSSSFIINLCSYELKIVTMPTMISNQYIL